MPKIVVRLNVKEAVHLKQRAKRFNVSRAELVAFLVEADLDPKLKAARTPCPVEPESEDIVTE